MVPKKKLIEVALPLEAINIASAREKSIRHGHPSTLHLWWARRPLAAARAVIFAQMVDDPSVHPDIFKTEKAQEKERQRLFRIIEELVKWENTTNETVLQQARDEIWQSWRYTCAENADHPRAKELFDRFKLPAFHDPFAGGGTLPLEAQRLGLESYASDLNPVAVLINKAMIEIPPKFAGKPPVHPNHAATSGYAALTRQTTDAMFEHKWKGAQGLAEDVRYYGQWMCDEAEKRIGHLYPKVEVTAAMAQERPDLNKHVGQKLTVIAWLWARTVKCANPACGKKMPLLSSCVLSSKAGREVYLSPTIEGSHLRFHIQKEPPTHIPDVKKGYKRGMSGIFECAFCGTVTTRNYVAEQAKTTGLGVLQTAVVVETGTGRMYLSPEVSPLPKSIPQADTEGLETEFSPNPRDVWCRNFGLMRPADLFTPRQLITLTTFSDLVGDARRLVELDAIQSGIVKDDRGLAQAGVGATAYAEAVGVYLAFALNKVADRGSTLGRWDPTPTQSGIINTFSRQALPMTWDFAESNPLGDASGNYRSAVNLVAKALLAGASSASAGYASQIDASVQEVSQNKVVSTDPPYYDNIGYGDLSDFFYAWLRRALRPVFPKLFSTMAVPKAEELIATSYRHSTKEKAEKFFLDGMTQAMHRIAEQAHPAYPVTIYYAFKQSESNSIDGTTNTGWDTFLAAVIEAGFDITGTWPMRTELSNRMISSGTNALASSIILVCRQRAANAPTATRRDFVASLKAELPQALAHLQAGNIAPVDLAQAAIGPGMAVYTRYAKVLDAEGKQLSVRAALALINQTLDEALAEQEGDFDADTRWALTWFDQVGFAEGDFGVANTLAQAKNTGMDGLVEAGIITSGKGKVRLLQPAELPVDWDPTTDTRLTVWEMVHHMVRVLEAGGEGAAAVIVAKLGSHAETARELCYRLYTLCERKKRANEAMAYNGLVQSWPEITRLAREKPSVGAAKPGTNDMFEAQ